MCKEKKKKLGLLMVRLKLAPRSLVLLSAASGLTIDNAASPFSPVGISLLSSVEGLKGWEEVEKGGRKKDPQSSQHWLQGTVES